MFNFYSLLHTTEKRKRHHHTWLVSIVFDDLVRARDSCGCGLLLASQVLDVQVDIRRLTPPSSESKYWRAGSEPTPVPHSPYGVLLLNSCNVLMNRRMVLGERGSWESIEARSTENTGKGICLALLNLKLSLQVSALWPTGSDRKSG